MMSGNAKKMIRNPYLFSVVSKSFGILIGFVFTIFQARYLGAEIKGQVTTVNSMVSISSILFGLGIYHSYPYFKRNSDRDILPVFFRIALLLGGLYTLVSAGIICFLRPSPKYIAALVLNPLVVYDEFVSYLTLIEVPNKRNATDMAIMLMELVILLILWIAAPPSFVIAILIITAKNVGKAILFSSWWWKRSLSRTEPIGKWTVKAVKFGFFPMLALLMNTLNYRVDILMLDGKVPDAAIGIYSIGVLLAERVWLATDAMKGVMVSNISKGKGTEETVFVIRMCNTLCFFLMVGIILLGKPLIHLAFGAEFSGAYQVTLVLLAGVFPMNYYKMIDAFHVAMGKQAASFVMMTLGVLCNIVMNYLLIPRMGILGAGIASVISYTLCSTCFILYFCHMTGESFNRMLMVNRGDMQRLRSLLRQSNKKA